jgi:hypothetical protein
MAAMVTLCWEDGRSSRILECPVPTSLLARAWILAQQQQLHNLAEAIYWNNRTIISFIPHGAGRTSSSRRRRTGRMQHPRSAASALAIWAGERKLTASQIDTGMQDNST